VGDVTNAMMRSGNSALLNDPESPQGSTDTLAWQPVAENALRVKVAHDGKIAQQFEQVRIKLLQQAAERRVQIHAVTSSLAGEGRTTCALHLALSFARMPATRVLLVDMDSQSHNGLLRYMDGKPVDGGVCDFVGGNKMSLDAVTYPTDMPGLHVMPYGHAQSMAGSTMLEHPRLGQMLQRCRDLYDHVVIDAPAVLGHGGATRMGRLCDQILLAVALRQTPTHELERAKRLLTEHNCQITGVVLTERK
jgi:Mrp family chromosome partitioning ATPase